MPIVQSSFLPHYFVQHTRVQTVAPALLRAPSRLSRVRQRLELPDGDFIDLDFTIKGRKKAAIISHGLEGSSDSQYVHGISRALDRECFDIFAWNMRGCSGELNRLLPSYHSGFTEDLETVINHVVGLGYPQIALIGFSVGGNITLKYLGEAPDRVPTSICASIVFSVPLDLASTAEELACDKNRFYMNIFLRSLLSKLNAKANYFPGEIDLSGADRIRTFAQYDARFIAPLFGFEGAADYWAKASAKPFLENICVPTLILSSKDDAFLRSDSFPTAVAEKSQHIHLEVSQFGGHVGFMYSYPWGRYYSEVRAVEFLREQCS